MPFQSTSPRTEEARKRTRKKRVAASKELSAKRAAERAAAREIERHLDEIGDRVFGPMQAAERRRPVAKAPPPVGPRHAERRASGRPEYVGDWERATGRSWESLSKWEKHDVEVAMGFPGARDDLRRQAFPETAIQNQPRTNVPSWGEAIIGNVLGMPGLASKLPGGWEAQPWSWWDALEGASVVPVGRVANVGARVARGVVGAERAARIGGIAGKVAHPVRTGGRRLAYRGATAHIPASPSSITLAWQTLGVDPAMGKLGEAADALRMSDSGVRRAVGSLITPASARARVPRRLGKLANTEARRIKAHRTPEINAIVRFTRFHPNQSAAHFWYAQLPPELRNKEGLAMIRERLESVLDGVRSGAVERDLRDAMVRFSAEGDEWAARSAAADLLYLGNWEKDLQTSINKLAQLEKKNHPVNERVIEAMRVLMDDREEILRAAGQLGDEAEGRKSILWYWLNGAEYIDPGTAQALGREAMDAGRTAAGAARQAARESDEIARQAKRDIYEASRPGPVSEVNKEVNRAALAGADARAATRTKVISATRKVDKLETELLDLLTRPNYPGEQRISQAISRLEQARRDLNTAKGDLRRLTREGGESASAQEFYGEVAAREAADTAQRIRTLRVTMEAHRGAGRAMREHAQRVLEDAHKAADEARSLSGSIRVPEGVAPAEGTIYTGHRLGTVPRQRGSLTTGGWSTGKTRKPQGVGQQNTLRLLESGRLRDDIRVVLEDWQAAQVFDFAERAKRDLYKMGEPILDSVKPGYVLLNPTGKRIPKHWRVSVAETLEDMGFDPEAAVSLEKALDNITDTFADDKDTIETILEYANRNGFFAELRQVPEDVVQRYFGEIVSPKMISNIGLKKGKTAGKVGDTVNDIIYASLIYSNPGYIPANLAGNLVFGALHQGAFLPQTLTKAGTLLAHGGDAIRAQVLNEVGQGVTASLSSGGKSVASRGIGTFARGMGHITDSGPRTAAFLHEASRATVPKAVRLSRSPWMTKSDYAKLEKLLNDPAYRDVLNDIKERAVQAMVDFDRLGPWEKAIAKRLLFVWPWIRGATAYPFRFAYDHPIRSAALGYVAAGGDVPGPVDDWRDAIKDRRLEDAPTYLSGAIEVGEAVVNGKAYPRIINTGPISPVQTMFQTVSTLTGQPGAESLWSLANPLIQAGVNVASKKSPWGTEAESYREAALQNAERLAPNAGLIQDLISPPEPGEAGMYPEDVTRGGRLKRAARVLPYAVDPKEVQAAAVRQGIAEPGPSDNQPQYRKDAQWVRDHPEKIHPDYIPFATGYREMLDLVREGMAEQSEVRKKSGAKISEAGRLKQEYAYKWQVVRVYRAELFEGIPESAFEDYWTYDEDSREYMKTLINDALEYKDVLGERISSIIDKARETE